jgi:hypothetical protein
MSLDVYLESTEPFQVDGPQIYIREDGATKQISREEWDRRFPGKEPATIESEGTEPAYSGNITHNLGRMAAAAGIYQHLWRPEELGITKAKELIEPLKGGLATLRADPERFKTYNPSNGWGSYDGLVQFVSDYLLACQAHPNAPVRVWR